MLHIIGTHYKPIHCIDNSSAKEPLLDNNHSNDTVFRNFTNSKILKQVWGFLTEDKVGHSVENVKLANSNRLWLEVKKMAIKYARY